MRILFVVAAAFLLAAIGADGADLAPWDAALHLHADQTAAGLNAYCLDGSKGGFYYRPAKNAGAATKWKIHIQGGGWCTTPMECVYRAASVLGSSASWPPNLSSLWVPGGVGFYGLMDDNSTNPFGDWHFVWLAYCDGASLTSDRAAPLVAGNVTLRFRGRALLDAHLAELERLYGFLSDATEVIVSGTSAGAIATYLHAGYIKSRLPRGARLVSVPDSGFFSDYPAYGSDPPVHAWYANMAGGLALWNGTLRGGAGRCLAELAPRGLGARCLFPQYLYPYLDDVDGLFVVQSMVDTANLANMFNLSCSLYPGGPDTCTAPEAAAIQAFAQDLVGNVTAARAPFAARDGLWLNSCFQHGDSCRVRDWYEILAGPRAQSANATLFEFYTRGGVAPGAVVMDGPWPSDASCPPQQRTDGGPGPC